MPGSIARHGHEFFTPTPSDNHSMFRGDTTRLFHTKTLQMICYAIAPTAYKEGKEKNNRVGTAFQSPQKS